MRRSSDRRILRITNMMMDYAKIRGFNYHPGYAKNLMDTWLRFDITVIRNELARGKEFFPQMNALRIWLSWDAYIYDPVKFCRSFDTFLSIAAENGLAINPVLFNRYHDPHNDFGGIYAEHFYQPLRNRDLHGNIIGFEEVFGAYLEDVVGKHASDERVFTWDLCNEPFSYREADAPEIARDEFSWLEWLYLSCKKAGAAAPICIGTATGSGIADMRRVEPISDVLSIHPYYAYGFPAENFNQYLDDCVKLSADKNKALFASETCWGSLHDYERADLVSYTLEQLKRRNIGWLAYVLNHSLMTDSHRQEYGYVGFPGILIFIESDGSLRRGHEVFNKF